MTSHVTKSRQNPQVIKLNDLLQCLSRSSIKQSEIYTVEKSKLTKLKERTINKYIPAQVTGQQGQSIYKLAKLTYGGRWQELRDKNAGIEANANLAGRIVEMLPL